MDRLHWVVTTCIGVAAVFLVWKVEWNNGQQCGTRTGSSGGMYYRITTSGRHCDTTATENTIISSIWNGLKAMDNNGNSIDETCGASCVWMSHSETLTVDAIIGTNENAVNTLSCSQLKSEYDNCYKSG